MVLVEGTISHRDRIVTPKAQVSESEDGTPGDSDDPGGSGAGVSSGGVSAEIYGRQASAHRPARHRIAGEIRREKASANFRRSPASTSASTPPPCPASSSFAAPSNGIAGDTPVMLHIYEQQKRKKIKIDPLIRVSSDRTIIEYLKTVVATQDALWTE